MTREEAIKEIQNMRKFNYTLAPEEVFDMAIGALKAIDDIKAEFISQYPKNVYGDLELGGRSCVFSLNKALEIIDKHKAERR